MLNHRLIRQVLRERLLTASGCPVAARIKAENRSFTPPDQDTPALWLDEYYIPVTERREATQMVEARGLVQYNVNWPAGKGTESPEGLAKAISDVFEPGYSISSQGVEVAIDRTERSQGRVDGVWYFIPVIITWRSYATTTY